MKFQTAYGEKLRPVVDCGGLEESRTKQSAANECDINILMAKYQNTGSLTHVNSMIPSYGDFSSTDDYLSASLKLMAADKAFQELPAQTRKRFSNDPRRFVAFVEDEDNYEEAREMGLLSADARPVPRSAPTPDLTAEVAPEGEN